jgi:hypothetical protein
MIVSQGGERAATMFSFWLKRKSRKGTMRQQISFKAQQNFEALSEEMREFISEALRSRDDREILFRGVVAGDCPICGSFNTLDGSDTPLGDNTVGICLDCCTMTCLECDAIFAKGQTQCLHRQICERCESHRENGCAISVWECPRIGDWKRTREAAKHYGAESALPMKVDYPNP